MSQIIIMQIRAIIQEFMSTVVLVQHTPESPCLHGVQCLFCAVLSIWMPVDVSRYKLSRHCGWLQVSKIRSMQAYHLELTQTSQHALCADSP